MHDLFQPTQQNANGRCSALSSRTLPPCAAMGLSLVPSGSQCVCAVVFLIGVFVCRGVVDETRQLDPVSNDTLTILRNKPNLSAAAMSLSIKGREPHAPIPLNVEISDERGLEASQEERIVSRAEVVGSVWEMGRTKRHRAHLSMSGFWLDKDHPEQESMELQLMPGEPPVRIEGLEMIDLMDEPFTTWFREDPVTGESVIFTKGVVSRSGQPTLSGTVRDRNGTTYQIRKIGGSVVGIVDKVEQFSPEGEEINLDMLNLTARRSLQTRESHIPPNRRLQATDDTAGEKTTMDLMVVYTDDAMCAAAWQGRGCSFDPYGSAIEGVLQTAVAEANQGYNLSGINGRIRLVHTIHDKTFEEASYRSMLENLADSNDGKLDYVHEERDRVGADFVVLVVNRPGSCGIAQVGEIQEPVAFSVVAWDCASGHYTLAHEIAHNMGCYHDRLEEDKEEDETNYFYGYQHPEGLFRTITATECPDDMSASCPRRNRFSSPNAYWTENGISYPTGDSKNDNVRWINEHLDTFASYRPEAEGVLATILTEAALPQFSNGGIETDLHVYAVGESIGITFSYGFMVPKPNDLIGIFRESASSMENLAMYRWTCEDSEIVCDEERVTLPVGFRPREGHTWPLPPGEYIVALHRMAVGVEIVWESEPFRIAIASEVQQETVGPMLTPTWAPSTRPTTQTMEPARSSTLSPTPGRSRQPISERPTFSPSTAPTLRPTGIPSVVPTLNPSAHPSSVPSQQPSPDPTTRNPSASPSFMENLQPVLPTSVPSSPIDSATRFPTVAPSPPPTLRPPRPTFTPTSLPTNVPTHMPSELPSVQPARPIPPPPRSPPPTNEPIQASTASPSGEPSIVPTPPRTFAPTFRRFSWSDITRAPAKAPSHIPTISTTFPDIDRDSSSGGFWSIATKAPSKSPSNTAPSIAPSTPVVPKVSSPSTMIPTRTPVEPFVPPSRTMPPFLLNEFFNGPLPSTSGPQLQPTATPSSAPKATSVAGNENGPVSSGTRSPSLSPAMSVPKGFGMQRPERTSSPSRLTNAPTAIPRTSPSPSQDVEVNTLQPSAVGSMAATAIVSDDSDEEDNHEEDDRFHENDIPQESVGAVPFVHGVASWLLLVGAVMTLLR